jgi:hypothetical protein
VLKCDPYEVVEMAGSSTVVLRGEEIRAADEHHGECVDVGRERDPPQTTLSSEIGGDHLGGLSQQRNAGGCGQA